MVGRMLVLRRGGICARLQRELGFVVIVAALCSPFIAGFVAATAREPGAAANGPVDADLAYWLVVVVRCALGIQIGMRMCELDFDGACRAGWRHAWITVGVLTLQGAMLTPCLGASSALLVCLALACWPLLVLRACHRLRAIARGTVRADGSAPIPRARARRARSRRPRR